MDKTNNFYSLLNVPDVIASQPGEAVYEWQYELNGELVSDKTNIYEMIQSGRAATDYKLQIKRGVIDDSNNGAIYADVSALGQSANSVDAWLSGISAALAEALAQSSSKDTKASSQDGKANQENKQALKQDTRASEGVNNE